LILRQGSGPYTVAWGAAVDWAGGAAPTLSAGNGDIDIFGLITRNGGTNVFGFIGGQDFS
jgi:hypothetical protein